MGRSFGPSFKGIYQLVPPPGAQVAGWSIKKGLKKAGRGVKKAGRGVKKAGKVAVKVHTRAIKTVAKAGKYALRATAKLAARPIIYVVGQLAGRRAKYLAFKRTGTTKTTLADRKAGGQYAFAKLRKSGPVGKLAVSILKFTGGVTAGDSTLGGIRRDISMCGITGAEIVAASGAIIAATKKIMSALNKPGEAPANPAAAAEEEQPTEETQPVVESSEESAEEEPAEDA